ncbi:MAG TPA: DEAD/DEAH box helicase [Candidatus Saccharimonadales bacterium]|nr:DEAD/DEAH box helicase [Candidatus Saccharimonadales bacterium]
MANELSLRDYQEDTIQSINDALKKGITKQVAVLATGLGKTVIFSHLLNQRVQKLHKKVLIIAHREELLTQAKEKLRKINPNLIVGIEQGENAADHINDNVIIASVATIGKGNSPRLLAFNPKDYSTIIIDEAHHASAESYRTILQHFGVLKDTPHDWNKDTLLLGVTATPNRNDNQGIDQIFDDVVYKYGIVDGIQNKWLSRINAVRINTGITIENVKDIAGDFSIRELTNAINTPQRNNLIVKSYQDLAQGKQALIFAADVEHAQDLFETFKKTGIKAGLVLGSTDKKVREEQLQKFAKKELQVMVNAMVLTEGYDNASIEFIFMARPTKSGILYQQMVGRGTRIHLDKEHLMIVDFVDNTVNHKIKTSASLLGIEGNIDFKGEDILSYKSKLDQLKDKRPYYNFDIVDIYNITYLLEEVDIIQQEEEKRINTLYNWHKFGDVFRIGIGDNRYFVIEQSLTGQYQLSKYNTNEGTRSYIATFLNKTDALRQADYLISQRFGNISSSSQERWQKDIPSEAQIQLLRDLDVDESTILMLDKGQASKLISQIKQSKKHF